MKYLFLIKAEEYVGSIKTSDLSCGDFQATIVAGSSLVDLIQHCLEALHRGVQVVELCGGFSKSDAEEVERRVGDRCALGHVQFSEAQKAVLFRMGFEG